MKLDDLTVNIFNAADEGILLIDAAGKIVFGNKAYLKFLEEENGFDIGDIRGKELKKLRPGARLPEVIATGKPLYQEPRMEENAVYYCNMYPIFEGETIVGGMSIVTFQAQANNLINQIEKARLKSKQILRRVNRGSRVYDFNYIVAVSDIAKRTKTLAQRLALGNMDLLITAESGSGKHVYAQAIHNASPRREHVLLSINCASFNQDNLDSELFGYAKDAFPGAKQEGKVGLFEAAGEGTLIIEEISEMNQKTQAKLFRALRDKTIRPEGSDEDIPIKARVIATSTAHLSQCVSDGKFRSDLYYFLSTFQIHIPSIREMPEDLPKLIRQTVRDVGIAMSQKLTLEDEAVSLLLKHSWPGNIDELRNVIQFSAYLSPDGIITAEILPDSIAKKVNAVSDEPLYKRIKKYERDEIERTLQKYDDTVEGKKAAAEELGISLSSLYGKLAK